MNSEQIGTNAGIVWKILNGSDKYLTIMEIQAISMLPIIEVAAAIGWLSREGKIDSREEIDHEDNERQMYGLFRFFF
jgi:cytosine/uracil/thiamine/allantoin permease